MFSWMTCLSRTSFSMRVLPNSRPNVSGANFSNASLVGANSVNGPPPPNVSVRPALASAVASVENSGMEETSLDSESRFFMSSVVESFAAPKGRCLVFSVGSGGRSSCNGGSC